MIPRLTELRPFKYQGLPISLWHWLLTYYDICIYWRDIALATCSRSQPLPNMYMEGHFEVTLWSHRWRHHHENNFFGISWDGLFISEVKLQLCLIFQNFQNGRHIQVATNFFYRMLYRKLNVPESWPLAFPIFWAFIDPLTPILTEIYQFQNLIYFVTWWRHRWRHEWMTHNLHKHRVKDTNKHTGWKHYHLANVGDN